MSYLVIKSSAITVRCATHHFSFHDRIRLFESADEIRLIVDIRYNESKLLVYLDKRMTMEFKSHLILALTIDKFSDVSAVRIVKEVNGRNFSENADGDAEEAILGYTA